jgi:hypothetical protein
VREAVRIDPANVGLEQASRTPGVIADAPDT